MFNVIANRQSESQINKHHSRIQNGTASVYSIFHLCVYNLLMNHKHSSLIYKLSYFGSLFLNFLWHFCSIQTWWNGWNNLFFHRAVFVKLIKLYSQIHCIYYNSTSDRKINTKINFPLATKLFGIKPTVSVPWIHLYKWIRFYHNQ